MKRKTVYLIWLSLLIGFLMGSCVYAGTPKYQWVEKDQYYYFYNKDGQLYKNGIYLIKAKKYCFDSEGRQLTGWRKVGKGTYFFRHQNAEKGYMLKSCKADGVKLNQYGRAVPDTARAKAKLPILLRTAVMNDTIVKPGMKPSKKLRICYDYAIRHFWEINIRDLGHKSGDWDINYAKFMLDHRYGTCYCYASVFAYMANAIGYKSVLVVNNDDHCWTEIGGKIYDVEWGKNIGADKCYAVSPALSAKDGRQNWARWRPYIKAVNE